jgi:hypothetical protein
MAYQVGQACYSSAVEAAQAQASIVVGGLVTQAGNVNSVTVTAVASDSITYVFTPAFGGTTTTYVAPFNPQPCNLLDSSDALALGWMVGAAWIGVYCVMFLAKVLRGETGDNYGNS